jgi:hypothetical protein
MLHSVKLRTVTAACFSVSEHCCAVGYALSEFAIVHSQVFLDVFSAVLLAALMVMGLIKATDHYRKVTRGYAEHFEAL